LHMKKFMLPSQKNSLDTTEALCRFRRGCVGPKPN
jgi:hypothetical protein